MADVETTPNEGEKEAAAGGVEATGEEDCSPEFTPIVKLTEIEVVKSDANEEIVWENKCKLYRFDEDTWKERGLGIAKILKHKTTHKQRFIMHEDKTFKLRSNHLIQPTTKLQQHGGNVKALVFSTIDFADGDPKEESLCIRFGTSEKAAEFRTKYEAAVTENAQYISQKSGEETDKKEEKETEDKTEDVVEKLTEELKEKVSVQDDTPAAQDNQN